MAEAAGLEAAGRRQELAVSMVGQFRGRRRAAVGDGDPHRKDLGDRQRLPPARWDQGTEQIFAYGMRAGIWRMLDG